MWDRERALDELQDVDEDDMSLAAYDCQCTNCGAVYWSRPRLCHLCASTELEPCE
jgi:uncharacterized OB-fold protein